MATQSHSDGHARLFVGDRHYRHTAAERFQCRILTRKGDIEGGEYDLFKSLSPEILSKIDKIAVETHDEKQNETFFLPGKVRHSFFWNYEN